MVPRSHTICIFRLKEIKEKQRETICHWSTWVTPIFSKQHYFVKDYSIYNNSRNTLTLNIPFFSLLISEWEGKSAVCLKRRCRASMNPWPRAILITNCTWWKFFHIKPWKKKPKAPNLPLIFICYIVYFACYCWIVLPNVLLLYNMDCWPSSLQ